MSRLVAAVVLLLCTACPGRSGGDPRGDAAVADSGADAGADAGVDAGELPDTGCPACACSGAAGTFHDQTLDSGAELRHYFLFVPPTYRCDTTWPLLIDFHGTTAGSATEAVEEAYALEGLISAATTEGFLVARPRSRSKQVGNLLYYQWDINDGDTARNVELTHALISTLRERYSIDPQRIYTAGFSNGTDMAFQLLGDSPRLVSGVGAIGGGVWNPPHVAAFGVDAPRIYDTTGYRDYMLSAQRDLVAWLSSASYPEDHLFLRQTDAEHELYGWQYVELFRWLDSNERPVSGSLASGWTSEASVGSDSLTRLLAFSDGSMLAASAKGRVFHRAAGQAWAPAAPVSATSAPAFVDLCLFSSGSGLAVGEGQVAVTTDSGRTWSPGAAVPDLYMTGFGYSTLTGVACSGAAATAVGPYGAVVTHDSGAQWSKASAEVFGAPASLQAIAVSPWGTWVAVGYSYLGWSTDGVAFTAVDPPEGVQWINAVAFGSTGQWWAVGERGLIFNSADDGKTWSTQVPPRREDLYGVSFSGARGVAVGLHGLVLLTVDSGAHWLDVSAGVDRYLSGAAWPDAHTVWVAGEDGTVLSRTVP